ncbi:hypothetical protein MAP00_002529 [Monascus purpureus]|nr:hypothetical protein MAP00_002529 [Monascus purpureus]
MQTTQTQITCAIRLTAFSVGSQYFSPSHYTYYSSSLLDSFSLDGCMIQGIQIDFFAVHLQCSVHRCSLPQASSPVRLAISVIIMISIILLDALLPNRIHLLPEE